MKICYFGNYDQNYSRNKILIRGLRKNGAEVVECNTRISGFGKYFDLIRKYYRLRGRYDIMIVGFPGFQSMILAKFLTRKPIVFDAFLSIYDSEVFDRKSVKKISVRALYYWLLDFLSCFLANRVLLDTNEHIAYFHKTFHFKRRKFHRVFVGADDQIFYPRPNRQEKKNFTIAFHGMFIPLQGIEYIVEAAEILRNEKISFDLIGCGQEFNKIKNKISDVVLKNINLIGRIPIEKIPDYIKNADVCLGIFGNTPKTNRVIPNKLYECIAMKKPVITADTRAVREIFSENHLMLCRAADGNDLAEKILILAANEELRRKLASKSHNLFKETFTPEKLGFNLFSICRELIHYE